MVYSVKKETSAYFNRYKEEGIVLYYFIRNNEKYALALYPEILGELEKSGIEANYELYDEEDNLIEDQKEIENLNLPKIPGASI